MKRALLGAIVAGLGLLSVLQTGCQQQAKVAPAPGAPEAVAKKAEPQITFDSLVYDFGKVGPGQKLNGEFKFTNTGDAPLKITNVEKCCGAVIKLDKKQLAPGESGALQVQYTSGRTAGAMSKKLYVNSNDKATPRAELTIKAETVLKVACEPQNLKLIINEENAACPKITLTSTDNQLFSISSFKATDDCMTAEIDSSVEAKQFVLQPKVDIEKLKNRKSGRINIGLVFSQSGTPPETLTIIFQALSRFTIRPSVLMVLYNNPNEPVKKSLWVINNYNEDFEIESTSIKEGYIKILSQNKEGNRYQFELEITPPGEDVKRFTDTFTINLKGGEKLEVPCRGIFRAPATKQAGQQTLSETKE